MFTFEAESTEMAIRAAVEAAARLRARLLARLEPWRSERHPLAVGSGIAFGPVTMGEVGIGPSTSTVVTGATVNLASRLCDVAHEFLGEVS